MEGVPAYSWDSRTSESLLGVEAVALSGGLILRRGVSALCLQISGQNRAERGFSTWKARILEKRAADIGSWIAFVSNWLWAESRRALTILVLFAKIGHHA